MLADDDFSPTFLRNATAYGMSPRIRADVVVNNLVGYAVTTHDVLLQTDGTQWRPLVHILDISRAFLAMLEAPRELVHAEAFNVGSTAENYQIRDVARIVEQIVPESKVALSGNVGADLRNYRVTCDKLAERLGFQTEWTVERGARQVYDAFVEHGLTFEQLTGPEMHAPAEDPPAARRPSPRRRASVAAERGRAHEPAGVTTLSVQPCRRALTQRDANLAE